VHHDAWREEAGGDDGHFQHGRNVPARRQDPRRVHGPHRQGRRRRLSLAVAVLHLAVVAWLTLLSLPITPEAIATARAFATYEHNPVPFATLAFQLDGGVTGFELRQLVGNVLLLLPLGIYGPMLWRPMRSAVPLLLTAVAISASIELGQLALSAAYGFPVRVADVDDVLLNTAGAGLGYIGWRLWPRQRPIESERHAVRHAADR
jgi:glycopeptide antibiotics resistance protein